MYQLCYLTWIKKKSNYPHLKEDNKINTYCCRNRKSSMLFNLILEIKWSFSKNSIFPGTVSLRSLKTASGPNRRIYLFYACDGGHKLYVSLKFLMGMYSWRNMLISSKIYHLFLLYFLLFVDQMMEVFQC